LKHRKIAESIAGMIATGQLRCGMKLPAEEQLAERFDVSKMTIRQAKIALLKQGVLVCIDRKGTFIAKTALMPRVAVIWHGDILRCQHGLGLPLVVSELQRRFAGRFVFRYFDGKMAFEPDEVRFSTLVQDLREYQPRVVVVPADGPHLAFLCRQHTFVLMGLSSCKGVPFVAVETDSVVRLGVTYLLRRGIRDIALICAGSSPSYESHRGRMNWLPQWFQASGPTVDGLFDTEQFGYSAFLRIWNAQRRPKGLVVSDDCVFKGVMLAMSTLGVEHGRDIHVVSHFNTNSPMFAPGRFVKALVDTEEYAIQAGALIRQLITFPQASHPPHYLKPTIVE
jgi:hypothetical protein